MSRTTRIGAVMAGTLGLAGLLLTTNEPQAQPTEDSTPRQSGGVITAREPLRNLGLLLDGFHYHDGSLQAQMEALHHCGEVHNGLFQCALFDPEGRLIGVEYVATAETVKKLPPEERALWHSHGFEVTSGLLLAPEIPPSEQVELMKTLAQTYGKTWHTWHTDQGDELPVGRPDLMMAFTKPGQARQDLTARRDQAFGVSTRQIRSRRSEIDPPSPIAGVDRGEDGKSCTGATPIRRVKGKTDRD